MDFIVKSFDDLIHIRPAPICAGKGAAGISVLIPGFVIRKVPAAVVFFIRIEIIVDMHRIDVVTFYQIFNDTGDMVLYPFIRRVHPVHSVSQFIYTL